MASAMCEYERLRAERIAKNAEVLAKLGVLDSARAIQQLPRPAKKSKGYKPAPKKPRTEPVVLRRSLRTKGVSPETDFSKVMEQEVSSGKKMDMVDISWENPVPFSKVGDEPEDKSLYTRIVNLARKQQGYDDDESLHPANFKFRDVARVVPDRIFSVMFLPLRGKTVLLAGDKSGNVGLWDSLHDDDRESVVQLFRPHKSPVSGIAAVPRDSTKIITSSYDGSVLLMDLEQTCFSRLHAANEEITALCYPATEASSGIIYLAQGDGDLKGIDSRSKGDLELGKLHDRRINTIDFNIQRPHLFATGSTDTKVSIWDVRKLKDQINLSTKAHNKAVSSVYFSPLGNQLVSTSYDNYVGLWKMKSTSMELDEPTLIHHNNQTNRWISTFRAIWSLDGKYVFIANMSRGIDIISSETKTLVSSLRNENDMTSIPCRLAQHPLVPGCLAGAAAGGKVYLWIYQLK